MGLERMEARMKERADDIINEATKTRLVCLI